MKLFTAVFLLGLVISFSPSFVVAQTSDKDKLKALTQLMAARQYAQAYELASTMTDRFEGEQNFDFALGLSAVESQHYDQALFAFERLLFQHPTESRYRLEFARTHFYLRNLERAEKEFKKVLKQKPPKAVRKNVNRFLDQIAVLKRSVEPAFIASVDFATGYDSNINSATSDKELPKEELIFPVDIELSDDSRETASPYWSTLASLYYVRPLTKIAHFDGRLIVSKKENSETEVYNLDTAMAEAAYSVNTGPFRWRAGGRYQHVLLNSEHLLDSQSGLGQVQWFLPGDFSIALGGTYGETLYVDNPASNLTQQQYSFLFSSPANWTVTFLYGDDTASKSEGEYYGKSYQGLEFRSNHLWGQRTSGYWGINMINSRHKAINQSLFSKRRQELASTLSAGWRYSILSSLTFRNDYSYTNTDSSLEANSFQRFKVEFGLTYSHQ